MTAGLSGVRTAKSPRDFGAAIASPPQSLWLDSTSVAAAVNMPPTPWTTLVRTCSTWRKASPRNWRTDSRIANLPYMPVGRSEEPTSELQSRDLPSFPTRRSSDLALDHAGAHMLDLAEGLAAQLAHRLQDREHAVHAGVRVEQAAAMGVERQGPAGPRVALGDERAGLAPTDETHVLQPVQRQVGERIVDHQVIDIGMADARLRKGCPAGQAKALCARHVVHHRDQRAVAGL